MLGPTFLLKGLHHGAVGWESLGRAVMLGPKLEKRSLLFPLIRLRYSLQELSPRFLNLVQDARTWYSLTVT